MIAAWMAYGLLAGVLLAGVGRALEEAARLTRLPTRWSWAGAIGLAVALMAWAPFRLAPPSGIDPALVAAGRDAAGAIPGGTGTGLAVSPLAAVAGAVDAAIRATLPFGTGMGGRVLASAWVLLTLLLASSGAGLLLRSLRVRRRWPRARVAGERVRISPAGGPVVAGIVRPEIVVPRWLVAAPEAEQRMAIAHEREHLRARDPHLLALGYLAVALLPWNPAVWWMQRRLRLAVELDCDRRVLRRGVRPRAYGSFLIDAAGLGRGPLPGAVTLAPAGRTLERRLEAMTRTLPRFAGARATVIAALGALALTTACEARLPTSAEIEDMDVAGAEAQIRPLATVSETASVTYVVDGEEVGAAEARAIAPEDIDRIEVIRTPAGDRLFVYTRGAGPAVTSPESAMAEAAEQVRIARGSSPGQGLAEFDGLLVIDGEIAPAGRLGELRPEAIERVEVLKGAAATLRFSEPEAANGVILITTKK